MEANFFRKLKKLGGSYIIRVDPDVVKVLKLKENSYLQITVEELKNED